MKMANKLTRDMVDKVIKKWLKKHPDQQETCNMKHAYYCTCDCVACSLDSLLADYERAGDRLNELYFRALKEI